MSSKNQYSLESERAVVGGLIIDNSKWPLVIAVVDADDFSSHQCKAIFEAIKQLAIKNEPFDIVTIPDQLKSMGKLGQAGSEGDIAEIAFNTPSAVNILVYANIVKQKSIERTELQLLDEVSQYLQSNKEDSQVYLQKMLAELTRLVSQSQGKNGYKPIALNDFLGMDIPERQLIMSPWLPEQGLAMIFAPRGIGKTFLALNIAYAIASGLSFLTWHVTKPRKVVYIDGEMAAKDMQNRLSAIEHMCGVKVSDKLSILTPDLQKLGMPDVGTFEGQQHLEAALEDVDVIILDNLSTLCRSGKENEAESWVIVQEWALQLRTQGKSVIFIHHSGKNGGQRGTSKREDILDTCISLKLPADANNQPKEGACFEVHFTKSRGFFGEDAEPIMVNLTRLSDREHKWEVQPLELSTRKKVLVLKNEGLTPKEIAAELEINKSTVSRHLKNALAEEKFI
jgi:hypothetical protein